MLQLELELCLSCQISVLEQQDQCCMKVFWAVAMGLQSGQFSLSGAGGHRPAVMTENKKMTLLLGMINGAPVMFAVSTTS